jgi:hypothetical protein
LLGGEFGLEGLHEGAVAVQLVAGDGGEDLQDPFGGRGLAVAELGVERDVVQGGATHAGSDLAFDEGGDVNRPESGGGTEATGEWFDASTEEVSERVA